MKESAGLLMFQYKNKQLQFFLAHPGGPYFKNKDQGAWTIPKGEIDAGENKLEGAKREFYEETGLMPEGPFIDIGLAKQTSKLIYAWAFEGSWDENNILLSNEFEIEWPPKSGQRKKFPEIDRVAFFEKDEAEQKILKGQLVFLKRLEDYLHNLDVK